MDFLTDPRNNVWLINVQRVDNDVLHVGAIWVRSHLREPEIVVLDETKNQLMIELPPETLNSEAPLVAYNIDIPIRHHV